MQIRLLPADDPLELGDARLGPGELVGAPGGGLAGVLGLVRSTSTPTPIAS
jgi:hypothetical protein